MILHLARHGQSSWNLERRLQGQTPDIPLTVTGHAQARDMADRLAAHGVTAVWSSDLLRARQTAERIADAHGLAVVTDERLRDVALGSLEGRSYDALVAEETPGDAHVSEVRWDGAPDPAGLSPPPASRAGSPER